MYTKHFGLTVLPFENVPDPKFFFDHGDYARVHSRIVDSLKAGRGLIVVTGPIGSGKTTMSQKIKSEFTDDIRLIWMAEPPSTSMDLFLFIAQELGLQPSSTERVFVLRDIRDALMKIHSQGSKCLMIVDESHLMTDDVLDSIRILNNLEDGSSKLLQMLMLGQEEIIGIINRPEMKPFKQRIAALEIIGRMDAERVHEYISYRIEVAGGKPDIFSDTGWDAIVLASGTGGGIPRIINSLCDKTLSVACEREKHSIDIDDVFEAAEGMGIDKDIFHYKIEQRKKEQQEDKPLVEEQPVKIPEKKVVQTSSFFDDIEPEEEQRSLTIPVVFLSLSIMSLILSFFFYCNKAESTDAITCLFDLISF